MSLIFSNKEWIVVFLLPFLVALITAFPDLYAIYKNEKRWVPINFPPYMLGDDYHYFSILNFIHRRFLNLFFKYKLSYPKLSTNTKFQMLVYLFNLPIYHMGFLFRDRRYGVLFVKIWNTTFLGSSFIFLFFVIINIIGTENKILYTLILSYITYILLFPGPFGTGMVKSILANLLNSKHILQSSHPNDLFRGMFSATSGPFFLLSLASLIYAHTINYSDAIVSLIVVAFIPLLFFVYFPVSIIYGLAVIISNIISHNFVILISVIIILIILVCLYVFQMSKDKYMKEVFYHNDQNKIFVISFRKILHFISVAIPSIAMAAWLIHEQYLFLGLLVGLFGSLVFTFFFKKHQLSRFYTRSSCITLQAIVVIFLIARINLVDFYLLLVFIFSSLLILYFVLQAFYLYKCSSIICSHQLYQRMNFASLFFKFNKKSKIIITDNFFISGLIDLFGSDKPLLRHYSIQTFGYKRHLKDICKNFVILNYSFKDLKNIFCSSVRRSDWEFKRPFNNLNPYFEKCYKYYMQELSCYREFNQQIIKDEMYSARNGWSKHFEKLLFRLFRQANKYKVSVNILII